MKPVFEYMNFREFLRDFYNAKKSEMPFYSYRLFSQKAGFSSPNVLKLAIDGNRNLTKDSVFRFCKAMNLNKKESEYFEHLVFFNQSSTLEEKNSYLSSMMKYRAKPGAKAIEKNEYSYYSQWFHPVIRELAASSDFANDFGRLAQLVVPPITTAEAKKSIKLLLELGFLRTDGNGTYWKTAESLSTGPAVRSVAVANYHKAMMEKASEAIERFKSAERDIESLTLSVSDETYRLMMKKARDFLVQELLPMAEADKKNERVIQVNLQMFPLSVPITMGREDSSGQE
jgi:uncharacterized protein (TIGR02147 family)